MTSTIEARGRSALRAVSAGGGIIGLAIAGTSASMFAVALALGIHCPQCDRSKVGDAYAFWVGYFHVLDLAALAALVPALVGVAFGSRRRYGAIALFVALAITLFRPF